MRVSKPKNKPAKVTRCFQLDSELDARLEELVKRSKNTTDVSKELRKFVIKGLKTK